MTRLARRLQNRPRILEIVYRLTVLVLRPFRSWLSPGGAIEAFFIRAEKLGKGILFDCRMCGDCVLHHTGMTCPMTCPKNLRNGPCGGVRIDGNCEVKPEMRCVWLEAWERSKSMHSYGSDMLKVLPPLDRSLEGSSAWINEFAGRARGAEWKSP